MTYSALLPAGSTGDPGLGRRGSISSLCLTMPSGPRQRQGLIGLEPARDLVLGDSVCRSVSAAWVRSGSASSARRAARSAAPR